MGLEQRIRDDLKVAQKEAATGSKTRLSTIRLLLAAVKNAEIAKGDTLDEAEILDILGREAKRRREATSEFRKGGREDLAQKEEQEEAILKEYLPEPLSESELEEVIAEAVTETGAETMKDLGKIMAAVMPRVKGRADGRLVQEKVRNRLQN